MTLELNLNTTTVAAVKATVDARLKSAWWASGVRILRSDLPFYGIRLGYQNRILAMGEVLCSCEVRQGTTLYAEWPPKSEKSERRKRYGKGRDEETVLETRVSRKKKEKSVEKKAPREAAKEKGSKSVEESTQSAHEIGGGGDECVSDARPGDNTELEVGDHVESGGNGTQCMSEQVAAEEQDEQRAVEAEGQDDGPTAEVEQGDPFADEEDNKENEEPLAWVPFEESSEDESPPAEECLLFDERNSGLEFDLMEEVSDY